jgi:hypothetical protein
VVNYIDENNNLEKSLQNGKLIGINDHETNMVLSKFVDKNKVNIDEHAFSNSGYYNNSDNWDNGALYIDNYLIEVKGNAANVFEIRPGTIGVARGAGGGNATTIIIPDSLCVVSRYGLGSIRITSFSVSETNPNFTSVDGVLFNKDKTILIQYPKGNTRTDYAIPDSVTSIRKGAFADCGTLKTVFIPDSVMLIEDNAFVNLISDSIIYCESQAVADLVPKSLAKYVVVDASKF